MKAPQSVAVVIVGGGPVGLAMALELGLRGVTSVVIEQLDATDSIMMCKAGGVMNERTMELFRRWGIADGAANWGAPADPPTDTLYCTSVFGYRIGQDRSSRGPNEFSAERVTKCPQTVLMPLLAKQALATGRVTILYRTKCYGFDEDGSGVDVHVGPAQGSAERTRIRADFLIACDGAASPIRESLAIPYEGTTLDYSLSIVFRIKDFGKYTGLPSVERFMFIGPNGTWANISSMDYLERWRLVLVGAQSKFDMAEVEVRELLERAIGRTDLDAEVINIIPWRRNERVARTFRKGRVLLAGDSAHSISPTGGHGLNTGFGDVVTLGWMLAGVLDGWASEDVLDAYTIERRPVALRNGVASTRSYKYWVGEIDFSQVLAEGPAGIRARERIGKALSAGLSPEWRSIGVALGYRFEGSPLVVPDGTPEPLDDDSKYIPTTRPGHRVPHAWLPDGRSTVQLFGEGYVLLRLGARPPDVSPFVAAAAAQKFPLRVVDIASDDIGRMFERRLVLVRPDGHSAWRGDIAPADAGDIVRRCRGAMRTPVVS